LIWINPLQVFENKIGPSGTRPRVGATIATGTPAARPATAAAAA
jgi:hypothetical protein